MNWLWFIPILLIMVVIHELGHYLTARYFGIKVHEFGIGFPPKLWSKKTKDGMEWSINALPIGGFVRIEGENGDSDHPDSFGKKPPWQRFIVLAAGPFMNIVLALVLYWAVNFFGGQQVEIGRPAVVDVSPNSPAALAGLKSGDIFVTANGKPVKTVADFRIETALDKNNPVQLVMERNGQPFAASVQPRKNPPESEGAIGISLGNSFQGQELKLGNAEALSKELNLSGDQAFKERDRIVAVDGQKFATNLAVIEYIRSTTRDSLSLAIERDGRSFTQQVPVKPRIDYIYKNSSAAGQNVPLGSIVTGVNSQPVSNRAEYEQAIQTNSGKQITLTYKKNAESAEQTALLLANTSQASGSENRAPRVSNYSFAVIQSTEHINYNPIEAVSQSWDQTTFAITLIPRTFKALFDGSVSVTSLAGPIGMAQITDTVVSQSAESGGVWGLLRSLAILTAMLSVNLGVVNILPLPALDGGRLVFVVIEMITRGRRVPPEKESLVHFAGMVVLLTAMVAIAWQDILRLVTGGSFQ